jgi:bromodomain-containing protein 7/9
MIFCFSIFFRKDANAFFAYPVNDVIAPGYSSIITDPMDLSTMRTKMDNGDYSNVLEYKVLQGFR